MSELSAYTVTETAPGKIADQPVKAGQTIKLSVSAALYPEAAGWIAPKKPAKGGAKGDQGKDGDE